MKIGLCLITSLLLASTSYACMYDKAVPYQKYYEDGWVDSFFVVGSKTEGSEFAITVKTYVKSNSTKQTCTKETFVVNCKSKSYHTERSTIYRNNIEISYNEKNPQRDIEDNIPAELFKLYCK